MGATIALDAMGGDFAPANPVAGAILAARELGSRVILVGRQDEIEECLSRHGPSDPSISIVHASEAVAMDEAPAMALRRKKDSSIRVAANLVQEGKADALVSAGNSGAVMATAMFVLGTVEGVDRPALAAVVPNLRGVSVWLDVGVQAKAWPVSAAPLGRPPAEYVRLSPSGSVAERTKLRGLVASTVLLPMPTRTGGRSTLATAIVTASEVCN